MMQAWAWGLGLRATNVSILSSQTTIDWNLVSRTRCRYCRATSKWCRRAASPFDQRRLSMFITIAEVFELTQEVCPNVSFISLHWLLRLQVAFGNHFANRDIWINAVFQRRSEKKVPELLANGPRWSELLLDKPPSVLIRFLNQKVAKRFNWLSDNFIG